MTFQRLFSNHKFKETVIKRVSPLGSFSGCKTIGKIVERLGSISEMMENGTYFISEEGGLPYGTTYWVTFLKWGDVTYAYHSEMIVDISETPLSVNINRNQVEYHWISMFKDIGYSAFEMSHYEYVDIVIDNFWVSLFGKSLSAAGCGGIVSAHGDKCYSYKRPWKEAGIPFERGALLFLLTYTKELGDTPKHKSCEWVIENYQKYLPLIQKAEKDCLFVE